jgi:hypothetical protein
MSPVDTSGEWRDERMYVLKKLEEISQEQREQAKVAAVLSNADLVKAHTDIQRAYVRIRILEQTGSTLKIKNWIMTAVLSGLVTMLYELVKGYIHK